MRLPPIFSSRSLSILKRGLKSKAFRMKKRTKYPMTWKNNVRFISNIRTPGPRRPGADGACSAAPDDCAPHLR